MVKATRTPAPPRRLVPAQHSAERPMGNRRSRFTEMANARVTNVLVQMDILAQLSERRRYHYTDEEWSKMHAALSAKLAELNRLFKKGRGSRPKFRLEAEE